MTNTDDEIYTYEELTTFDEGMPLDKFMEELDSIIADTEFTDESKPEDAMNRSNVWKIASFDGNEIAKFDQSPNKPTP